ncbi:MAG: class I SAM-dependent methyltransferase [Sandaracinaceae bacterium]|nr:class I SAM-dependent methyltransferase [Sandaracinaceae bacterium]
MSLVYEPSRWHGRELDQFLDGYPRLLELLRGDDGRAFMDYMRALSEGRRALPPKHVIAQAHELGLVGRWGIRVTSLGQRVGDSLREYLYWEERGRDLPRAEAVPELRRDAHRGARVLEVGCGSGINLLSLHGFAAELVGLDPDPVYLALGRVLAELAELPAPETVCAMAEAIPLPDESFDVALVIGALQYTEILPTLEEVARVLKPGGRGVIILGHLGGYLRHSFVPSARRSLRAFARETRELVGMLTYPRIGRRLTRPGAAVYPTRRRKADYLRRAGLALTAVRDLDDETAYVVRRP